MSHSSFPKMRIRFMPGVDHKDPELHRVRPQYIDALDGIPLAIYRHFPPFEPEKVVIFYHDAGVYQCDAYHDMAEELKTQYNIGVYLVEMRGHGLSGGRADAFSSAEVLLDDIQQVVRHIAHRHPKAHLYLAGHSQASAMLVHYGLRRHVAPLSALILIAPYFGPVQLTLSPGRAIKPPLGRLSRLNYLIHYLSAGRYLLHQPAWELDPSPLVGPRDPKLVTRYTTEMARYMNLWRSAKALGKLPLPFLLLAPRLEERFNLEGEVSSWQAVAQSKEGSVVERSNEGDFIQLLHQTPDFISRQTTLQTYR